jgi:hypothetical protein
VSWARENSIALDLKKRGHRRHRAPNPRQACSTVGVQKIIRWRPLVWHISGPGLLGCRWSALATPSGGDSHLPHRHRGWPFCHREYHNPMVTKPVLRLSPRTSWRRCQACIRLPAQPGNDPMCIETRLAAAQCMHACHVLSGRETFGLTVCVVFSLFKHSVSADRKRRLGDGDGRQSVNLGRCQASRR